MKFTIHLILFFFLLITNTNFAQTIDLEEIFHDTGEVYFRLEVDDINQLNKLSHMVSVDDFDGRFAWAYANRKEFSDFLESTLSWELLPKPGNALENPVMKDQVDVSELESWDFYPTYDAYLDMMDQFALDYPALCEVFSIGNSVEGRELMMAKISVNVGQREVEPQFLYTGTMHGDEVAGYILLLRLIDHLLSSYGSDPDITALLEGCEIWINPLANPDGTYNAGNHTVSGATRYNANWVDLNRNYPDPDDGPHPDGNPWQAETLAFMQLAAENHFTMSANTHGGAEVINYPWDTWQHLTADNDWWVFVSREYADTVHQYAPSWYLDGFNNGITNGYAWYSISGGRQDYMNFFHHCREVTMELSNTKMPPASQLPGYWDWNHRSLINYIRQCTYGVAGLVTDSETGEPLKAEVYIEGHDQDESQVWTDSLTGYYQRLLEAGMYDLTFTAAGYVPLTIEGVSVSRYETTNLDVQLETGELIADFSASQSLIPTGSSVDFTDDSWGNPISWEWHFEGGTPDVSGQQNPSGIFYYTPGDYDVRLTITDDEGNTKTVSKPLCITVRDGYNMSSESIAIRSGLFYDSGGPQGNYSNDEDFNMTFIPDVSGAEISVEFSGFNLESHSSCSYDWLKIYDGTNTSATLIGTFCGTDSPGFVEASNPDGALTFVFHSDYSVNKPGWKALISSRGEQQVDLQQGWNGIGLYLQPNDPDVDDLLEEIIDDVEIVVGSEGAYMPQENINTLGSWNSRKAYWIKTTAETSFNVFGSLLVHQPVKLQEDWNFVPQNMLCAFGIADVMNQLGDKLVMIKQAPGCQVVWPEKNIQGFQEFLPGQTFLFLLNEPAELIIPDCE